MTLSVKVHFGLARDAKKNSIRDARTPQPTEIFLINYGLDVLNITMHTEVVIHSMNAYVWCWSKICGSLDEIPSVTMGSYKSKILNKF